MTVIDFFFSFKCAVIWLAKKKNKSTVGLLWFVVNGLPFLVLHAHTHSYTGGRGYHARGQSDNHWNTHSHADGTASGAIWGTLWHVDCGGSDHFLPRRGWLLSLLTHSYNNKAQCSNVQFAYYNSAEDISVFAAALKGTVHSNHKYNIWPLVLIPSHTTQPKVRGDTVTSIWDYLLLWQPPLSLCWTWL